jgi:hypothetical protein
MRFGLIITSQKHKGSPTGYKQLSWHPEGVTSNACLKIDGEQYLFGHPPAKWVQMEALLGTDAQGKERLGRKSIARLPGKIRVTQMIEIVRGPITGRLDMCRVQYVIENRSSKPHKVGLRYLLDTLVGTNDGPPFVVPTREELCEKFMQFPTPAKVPPVVFALEKMDLKDPGVVAQIGLRLPEPVEAPDRLTLGGWPEEKKVKGAAGGLTKWDVPVYSISKTGDSAVAIYWNEKHLPPGSKRAVGFTYGLGSFTANSAGTLGVLVAGEPYVGGELVVTALVKDPQYKQTVVLTSAPGFEMSIGPAEQTVFFLPGLQGEYSYGPVSWRLRPVQAGTLSLRVKTNTGAAHECVLKIQGK